LKETAEQVAPYSSVTEEHGALRHILSRGPLKNFFGSPPSPKKFSVSVPFWESKNFPDIPQFFLKTKNFIVIPYNRINLNHDRINLNLVGAPNCRGPLVLELTLTTVRYATGPIPVSTVQSLFTIWFPS
jgi:hypothetical protein